MPADFKVIQSHAQIVNDSSSTMLQAVQAFQAVKVAGMTPTVAQRSELRALFMSAFAAVKAACTAIDVELSA